MNTHLHMPWNIIKYIIQEACILACKHNSDSKYSTSSFLSIKQSQNDRASTLMANDIIKIYVMKYFYSYIVFHQKHDVISANSKNLNLHTTIIVILSLSIQGGWADPAETAVPSQDQRSPEGCRGLPSSGGQHQQTRPGRVQVHINSKIISYSGHCKTYWKKMGVKSNSMRIWQEYDFPPKISKPVRVMIYERICA